MLAEGWPGRGSRRRGSTKHRGGDDGCQLAGDARVVVIVGYGILEALPSPTGAGPTGAGAG